MEVRSEVRCTIGSQLLFLTAISPHNHDLQLRWHHKLAGQQVSKLLKIGRGAGSTRTPDDPLAVLGVKGSTVVARFVCQSTLVPSIDIHFVQLNVVIAS